MFPDLSESIVNGSIHKMIKRLERNGTLQQYTLSFGASNINKR